MKIKEIRKKLLNEQYIAMHLGLYGDFGYFLIILPKHNKKFFRRFKYVFDDDVYKIKIKDYHKFWWFIDEK